MPGGLPGERREYFPNPCMFLLGYKSIRSLVVHRRSSCHRRPSFVCYPMILLPFIRERLGVWELGHNFGPNPFCPSYIISLASLISAGVILLPPDEAPGLEAFNSSYREVLRGEILKWLADQICDVERRGFYQHLIALQLAFIERLLPSELAALVLIISFHYSLKVFFFS